MQALLPEYCYGFKPLATSNPESVNFRKEKSILRLCFINLFRFCSAATITASMFTFSKRRRRNRSNDEILSLRQTEAQPTHFVCAWLLDTLPSVGNSPLYRDTLGKMNGKYAAHFYSQCICFLPGRHCTHSLWRNRELLAPFFFER